VLRATNEAFILVVRKVLVDSLALDVRGGTGSQQTVKNRSNRNSKLSGERKTRGGGVGGANDALQISGGAEHGCRMIERIELGKLSMHMHRNRPMHMHRDQLKPSVWCSPLTAQRRA
jgi:hypothetical protein